MAIDDASHGHAVERFHARRTRDAALRASTTMLARVKKCASTLSVSALARVARASMGAMNRGRAMAARVDAVSEPSRTSRRRVATTTETRPRVSDEVRSNARGKCLCREVLSAAASRCKEPASNAYATYNCSRVSDILNATSGKHRAFGKSHWIDGEAHVSEAVRQMHATDLGALVVMDRIALDADATGVISDEELALSAENDAIIGIFTERDYLNAVAKGVISPKTKVSEIMTGFRDASTQVSRLVCVSPQDTALAAMESMTTHRLRHIPVISSKGIDSKKKTPIEPRVLGVVSIGEVLKALLAESRSEIEHLESYILGLE